MAMTYFLFYASKLLETRKKCWARLNFFRSPDLLKPARYLSVVLAVSSSFSRFDIVQPAVAAVDIME